MAVLRRVNSFLYNMSRHFSSAVVDTAAIEPFNYGGSGGGGGGGKDTLGRRLLSLIYPKRSALVVLRKWAEEGKTVQKYQLNRVVRELRKYKRYKHALEICEWMTIQKDIKLLPGDYAIHLDLVAKVRGVASAEKFFEDLPEKMKIQSTCTALLHTFVQNKLTSKAESLMEEMCSHSLVDCVLPFNHMIELYIATGDLEKIPKIIRELKKNTTPDELTFNLLLTACSIKEDVKGADDIFLEMRRAKVSPDWVTYSILTSIYIKASRLQKAKEALEEMEKRVSRKERTGFCSLISLHANLSDKENVLRLWSKMKSMFTKMSDVEYKCMLSSLVRLADINDAEIIYHEWEMVSGTRDSRVPNILLGFYTKHRMMDKAERFYDHIVQEGVKPSYPIWETLALGYLNQKQMNKALDCLEKALGSLERWEPNDAIVKEMFHELEKFGDIEGAERFLAMLRDTGYVTSEVYNSLLRTYAKAGKMPLIIAERMKTDNVEMNNETIKLIEMTSKHCVGSASALIS